jgi:hypothetical protein
MSDAWALFSTYWRFLVLLPLPGLLQGHPGGRRGTNAARHQWRRAQAADHC